MKHLITLIRIFFLALFIFLIVNGKMLLWLTLFGASLIMAILFGRVYCGYACPMNTMMIPVERLSKKLKWQTDKSPKWLSSGNIGWIALIGSLAIMLLGRKVLNKNIPILLIWLAVAVLTTLRFKPAVFHNQICPFGVIQRLFSGGFTKFTKRVNKEKCIGCKLCEKACPSEAILVNAVDKKAEINKLYCFQCTNCQEVCPVNCIGYAK